MHQYQSLLTTFGSPHTRVQRAITAVRQGQGVLIVDDENRENEGDLVFSAETLTTPQMAMLIRECSGIVCLCLPDTYLKRLGLPQMVDQNTNTHGTAFTVSIEAASGITTGVSAADRVATVRAAVNPSALPAHLHRPGHIFPLRARPNGVLERRGHTEATVDIMRLAGLAPCGVLCEVTNPDGTMARLPQLVQFATVHKLPILAVDDLVCHRSSLQ